MPRRLSFCVIHEDCRRHPELGRACGPCEVPTQEEANEEAIKAYRLRSRMLGRMLRPLLERGASGRELLEASERVKPLRYESRVLLEHDILAPRHAVVLSEGELQIVLLPKGAL
jgi:hypothetical protein